jgi:hypothetical protein
MKNKTVIPIVLCCTVVILGCALFFRTDCGIVAFKRLSTLNRFVIDGKNGWLFYRGDLDYALLPWRSAAKGLVAIDSIAKQNNARLIIVPVPNKIDLYPEQLDDRLKDFPLLSRKSARFMSRLRNRNVAVLDLFDAYRKVLDSAPLYDPDEAHVTSAGIKIAVEQTVRKFFPLHANGPDTCIARKPAAFLGNLAEKKGDSSAKRVIDIWCNVCRRDAPAADTILIAGDSYCDYLKQFGGSYCDLLESRLGGRYYFQTYSKIDAGFKLSGKIVSLLEKRPRRKTIIWIFTAREFYKPLRVARR